MRRIYADTSVIGGCEDEEFRVHSRRLMATFAKGDAQLVLSELVLRELDAAPPAVRDVETAIPVAHMEIIRLSREAEALARQYLSEGILTTNMFADAQHIAMATVARGPARWIKREPSVSFVAKATEEAKTLDTQPRRTLRRTGSGMRGEPSGPQGRSHGVAGPHPAEGVA